MEQRTNIVDAVKLFFAVCIIAMHTSLLNQFSEPVYWYVMHLLFRLAVPFFFVASGFFLGKKMLPIADNREKRIAVCIQYAKKLIPSFLFWSTIGLIWYTITLIRSRVPHIPLKVIQTAIFYPQGAMWFVSASIFAVLAIGQLWNYKKLLIFTSMGGYIFALICNSYYFLVADSWMGNVVDSYMRMFLTARNFLGIGLIYIGLGVWLSSEKCFVNKQSTKFLVVYTILFYCVLIGEVTFCYGKKVLDDSSCFVSLPFLAVCFLALSLRIKANFSEHASKKMRRISADFYYLHPALNNYIGTIVFSLVGNYIVRFAVVFALCITFWIITNRSENKFIRAVLP